MGVAVGGVSGLHERRGEEGISLDITPVFACAVSEQLSAQYGAVKMLHTRIQLVLDYLKMVQAGKCRD